ncbi:hypothetical protein [Sinorhizobium meliloti]|uniref:hypothetical protein n=1 Tax=Rhizobium meliloti TaxID=382 RepID=UPI000FD749CF|nr:hypothetical protein [Sinorhizobium meliloti]RVE93512.1 hypothetical protein CN238_00295 [Sinorhizobium meliloti]RVH34349.1 hypothetical protein CN214_04475 [Sinorhizobium meliloti]
MINELLSGMLMLGLLAGSVPVLNDIRDEICVAVLEPEKLGRSLTPMESFIAANKGASFARVCE